MAFGGSAGVTEVLMKFTGDASGAIKSMKGFDQKFGATMSKMKTVGLATFTAVTGSLTAMAVSTAKLGDHFQKMSMQTGMSVEALSGLRFAAEQGGSSVEALEKGVLRMSRGMFEASQGVGEYADTYKELDIAVVNTDGTLRDTEDVMMDVADRFANMEDGAKKTALAQEIFGKAGAALIPMLNLGRDGIKEMTDEAERLGIVFDQDAADASANFNDRLNELKLSFSGIKNQIGLVVVEAVTPYIEKVKEVVVQAVSWMKANKELVTTIIKTVAVIGGAGGLLALIGLIAPLIAGAVGVLFGPVGLIAGLVALAAVASGLSFKDLPMLTEKFSQLTTSVIGGARAIGEFLHILGETTDPVELNNRAMQSLNNVIQGLESGFMSTEAAYRLLHHTTRENTDVTIALTEAMGDEKQIVQILKNELERLKNLKIETKDETGLLTEAEKRLDEILAQLGTVTVPEYAAAIEDSTETVEEHAFSTMDFFTRGLPIWTMLGMKEWTKYNLWAQDTSEDALGQIDEDTYNLLMLSIPGYMGGSLGDWTQFSGAVGRTYGENAADKIEKRTENLFDTLTGLMTDWKNKSWTDWLGDIVDLFGWANPHGAIGEMRKNHEGFLAQMSESGNAWLGASNGLAGFLSSFKNAFGGMLGDLGQRFNDWLGGLGSALSDFISSFSAWWGFFSWLSNIIGGGGPEENPPGGEAWWGWHRRWTDPGTKGLPREPAPWYGGENFQHGGILQEPVVGFGRSGRRYSFAETGPEAFAGVGKGLGNNIIVNINYPLLLNGAAIKTVTHAVQRELTETLADRGLVSFAGA